MAKAKKILTSRSSISPVTTTVKPVSTASLSQSAQGASGTSKDTTQSDISKIFDSVSKQQRDMAIQQKSLGKQQEQIDENLLSTGKLINEIKDQKETIRGMNQIVLSVVVVLLVMVAAILLDVFYQTQQSNENKQKAYQDLMDNVMSQKVQIELLRRELKVPQDQVIPFPVR